MRPVALRPPVPRAALVAVGVVLAASAAGLAVAGARRSPTAGPRAAYFESHPRERRSRDGATTKPALPRPRGRSAGRDRSRRPGARGGSPLADYGSGRAAKGYICNAVQVGHTGTTGGFKTFRYTDRAGRVCAFYDGTLLFPTAVFHQRGRWRPRPGHERPGAADRDRPTAHPGDADPARVAGAQRASAGCSPPARATPATAPGVVDVYDVSQDCRQPVLKSTTPLGILGHESGFSPDGRTLWISTTARAGVAAIDVSNPSLPSIVVYDSTSHVPRHELQR